MLMRLFEKTKQLARRIKSWFSRALEKIYDFFKPAIPVHNKSNNYIDTQLLNASPSTSSIPLAVLIEQKRPDGWGESLEEQYQQLLKTIQNSPDYVLTEVDENLVNRLIYAYIQSGAITYFQRLTKLFDSGLEGTVKNLAESKQENLTVETMNKLKRKNSLRAYF